MNYKQQTVLLLFAIILFIHPAIGQKNPLKVQPFVADITSHFPSVRDLAVSPDGNEIYFTAQSYLGELSVIVYSKKSKDLWSKPTIVSFSGRFNDLEPFISHDGLRLYFASSRPLNKNEKEPKDFDIWYSERKTINDSWSEPVNPGLPLNTKENEFYPSVSNSGNLYFTSDGPASKGKDDIFVCKWKDEKFQSPIALGDSVNSEGYEFNAFIAPDESYLIYTCYNRPDGLGSGDLYISFNKGDNQWTAPKNLGENINSKQMDYCPFVNTKDGVLYFTSKRSGVRGDFDKSQNIDEILKEMHRHDNGQSKLYQTKINLTR